MFGEFSFEVLGATKGENPTNPDYLENLYCVATVPVSHAGTVTRSVAVLSISQESHNLIEYLQSAPDMYGAEIKYTSQRYKYLKLKLKT